MAINVPSYSNLLFFKAACEAALREESRENYQHVIQKIKDRKRPAADGYWKRPQGEEKHCYALTMLANILDQNTGNTVIQFMQKEIEEEIYKQKTFKIVFLLQEHDIWPGVEHFYRAAAVDPRFEAQAVYVPFSHVNATKKDHNMETYQADGIPVVNADNYDMAAENPDIVVFTKPYDSIPKQFYITEVEKIVRYTIYASYGLELNKTLIKYSFHDYTHYSAWRHLAYGENVKKYAKQYGYRDGENIAVWGHPRVDNYHEKNIAKVPQRWKEKVAGRKVILWCPHHSVVSGPECVSTWKENYKFIFAWFREHQDTVLLWRPHPLLFGALVNNRYMTKKEMDMFLAEKQAEKNIILDRTPDYRPAFSLSDAIITDGTSFSIEYLLTGKPLMVTAASLEMFCEPEAMGKALYIGKSHEDISKFIGNVQAGKDPKWEARMAYTDQLFFRPTRKTVSENILDNICSDIGMDIQTKFD